MSVNRKIGVASLIGAVLAWATAPVFVHYFSKAFDQTTQNFFRYFSSTCLLWIVSLVFFRDHLKKAMRSVRKFIFPVAMNIIFQGFWVWGLTYIQPAFGTLVAKSGVLFAALFAYIFYRDERASIRSAKYIGGTLLALGGIAGLILSGRVDSRVYLKGVLLLTAGALFWSIYGIAVKRVLRDINPIASFTMISTYTTAVFLILMFAFGRPGDFLASSWRVKLLLTGSGVLCIATAHTFYYIGIKNLGVAISASFTLSQPLITAVISYIVFSEMLNLFQILSGLLIIAGSFLVIRASNRTD